MCVTEDYRKYKYYFDIYHEFKRLYYTLHNEFFDRIFRHAKRALVATFRCHRNESVGDFLAKETLIDSRLAKLFESVDEVLTGHYCHVDDMASLKFFSNFRYFYDERAYKKMRHEFDYHLGHEFFKSARE